MRVTSNLFPETLKDQLNYIQDRQLYYQSQVATGLKLLKPSDNPADYSVAQAGTENLNALQGYSASSDTAHDALSRNHAAMTQLHKLVSRAYELGQRGNNVYNPGDIKAWAAELEEIINQVQQLANTQVEGYYIFGGSENMQPVTGASAATYVLNAAPPATLTKQTAQVNENYTVETGIFAGNSALPANGFLYDGTTNILTSLQSAYNTLNNGQVLSVAQTDNLRLSQEMVSGYVGKTASKLAALEANSSRLTFDTERGKERMVTLTQANMAESLTELSKVQFNYQAALQSGARIMNISLMDYLR